MLEDKVAYLRLYEPNDVMIWIVICEHCKCCTNICSPQVFDALVAILHSNVVSQIMWLSMVMLLLQLLL